MRGVTAAFATAAVLWFGCGGSAALADTDARPPIKPLRWEEDWGVLADPNLRTGWLDPLKYVPLGPDPDFYLGFGAQVRERYESNDAPRFGVGGSEGDGYLLHRLLVHGDLHLGEHVRVFAQVENALAPGKDTLAPIDENDFDLRLAFADLMLPAGGGDLTLRGGRQEIAFDIQRFVSVRDAANLRQAFDGGRAIWADEALTLTAFAAWPVVYDDDEAFDDDTSDDIAFAGVRGEARRPLGLPGEADLYYYRYEKEKSAIGGVTGDEERHVVGLRYAGKAAPVDWDLEVMGQLGSHAGRDIRAWAVGALGGYSFGDTPWTPRLGLQVDAASGDGDPGDGTLGTFNPLFPRVTYFSLAGYTGFSNLVHVKPSVTLYPGEGVSVLGGWGFLWRESERDAVYVQPFTPVPGTAAQGGHEIGNYLQGRAEWRVHEYLTLSVEGVHFEAGDAIRDAGGEDADFLAVESNVRF
jgi:hypothetical protein